MLRDQTGQDRCRQASRARLLFVAAMALCWAAGCNSRIIRMEYGKPTAAPPIGQKVQLEVRNDRPKDGEGGDDPTLVVRTTRSFYTVPERQVDRVVGDVISDALAAAGYEGVRGSAAGSGPRLVVSIKELLGRGFNTFVMTLDLHLELRGGSQGAGEVLWQDDLKTEGLVVLVWSTDELNQGFTAMFNKAMPILIEMFKSPEFKKAAGSR